MAESIAHNQETMMENPRPRRPLNNTTARVLPLLLPLKGLFIHYEFLSHI
uniref:Uncharacterized protein n=1 Tax=Cucumis melo TaxID=3656 RepID=A0A9I9CML1_CUCME